MFIEWNDTLDKLDNKLFEMENTIKSFYIYYYFFDTKILLLNF